MTYVVYDNQDEDNIKSLVIINSDEGIEYIQKDDGKKINANGKKQVAIDYVVKKNKEIPIIIKEIGKELQEKNILINDDVIYETALKLDEKFDFQGFKTVEIDNLTGLSGYKVYYKIGKNSQWIEGSGKISLIDYDLSTNGLINDDNTVTIEAKIQNTATSNIVSISKNFEVNTEFTELITKDIEADSLIDAVEQCGFGTGVYNVNISDQAYNLKVYAIDSNLAIESNLTIGTFQDVGTASENAKNMIVLKVNGDLTIDSGKTLTAYGTQYGGPKGFMVYCTGVLTNNGTISMTGKGGKAPGQNVYMWKNTNETYEYVPATGAAGGSGFSYYQNGSRRQRNGNAGAVGTERRTGGGGSGSALCYNYTAYVGAGGSGTSYSGGTGSGASYSDGWPGVSSTNSGAGSSAGAAGGYGSASYYNYSSYPGRIAFGGTGNPSGAYSIVRSPVTSYEERNGTGGLMIIYGKSVMNNGTMQALGISPSTGYSNYGNGYSTRYWWGIRWRKYKYFLYRFS